MQDLELIAQIESRAANAWPSAIVRSADTLILRATPNVARRRSNSAIYLRQATQVDAATLVEVEEFYQAHRLPPRFQITPLSLLLDSTLEQRGWVGGGETLVQVGAVERALETGTSTRRSVMLSEDPSSDWLEVWKIALGQTDADVQRAEILDRIRPPKAYALLRDEKGAVAIGLGVVDKGVVGIFCMATMPRSSRQGAGSTILRSLLRWGGERGASTAYLQVDKHNTVAQKFYEALGFETLYRYHYRTLG